MKPQSASEQKTSIQDIRGPVLRKRVRRPPGRPRKGEEKNPIVVSRSKRSWTRKTHAYVKMVTAGKGAPCKVWSTKEKRRLLQGLQQHSHQDWDSLCKLIPSRTKEEIQEYIHTLKGGEHCRSKTKEGHDIHLSWAPIESWLDMSSEMVHYEQADLSNTLSRVFSVIGHFGSFPQPNSSRSGLVPDYSKIYRYIAAIMDESLSMPELSPLESAIIADLMHSLGDLLRISDTSLQRKVMCWKYKMLNYKFEFDDVRGSLDRIRKALTNDFSDLQKNSSQGVSGLPSFSQAASSTSSQIASPAASGSSIPESSSPFVMNAHTATSAASTAESSSRGGFSPYVTDRRTAGPEASVPASAVSSGFSPYITHTQLSVTPSGAASSTTPSQPGQTSGDPSVSANHQSVPGLSTSTNGHQTLTPQAEDEDKPKRGRGRPRVHDWRRPIDKPRLFTMNPFCVPIRLLRLKSLLGEAAARTVIASGAARERSISVSTTCSETSSQPSNKRTLSVESDTDQAQVTNSIRQVTGLYVPVMYRKNKKRLPPGQAQASASTMKAISATLAKRTQEKEVTTPQGHSAAGPRFVQIAKKGNSSSSVPTQAFRCVRLHDGKTALVPLHLSDASTLSRLEMREAVPVPKRMPALKACPGLQGQEITGSSPARNINAPGTRRASAPGMSGHREESSSTSQSTISSQPLVFADNQPVSVAASSQKGPLPQRDSATRQQVTVQESLNSQAQDTFRSAPETEEIVRLALAPSKLNPASSRNSGVVEHSKSQLQSHVQPAWVPSRKRIHSPEPFLTPVTIQQREDGTTVRQIFQILPRKRKQFVKQVSPQATTTEIFVKPPPGLRIEPAPRTSSTSKTSCAKPQLAEQPDTSDSKPAKCSATKKKAKTSKSRSLKAKTELSSGEPTPNSRTSVGTSESQDTSQSPAKRKTSGRRRGKASKPKDSTVVLSDQASDPPESIGQARPSQNGGTVQVPPDVISPQTSFPHPQESNTGVPVVGLTGPSAKTKPLVVEKAKSQSSEGHGVGQKSQSTTHTAGSSSHFGVTNFTFKASEDHSSENPVPPRNAPQTLTKESSKQICGAPSNQTQASSPSSSFSSAVSQLTPDQNKKGKSSFKTILAQVASSPYASSPSTVQSGARSISSDRSSGMEDKTLADKTNSAHSLPPSSSPSSSSLSHAKTLKLTKAFLSVKEPQTKSSSATSSRGRKKKTEGSVNDNQSNSSKTVRSAKLIASHQTGTKKPRGSAAASKVSQGSAVAPKTTCLPGKKRPKNFLSSEDISNMQVEIVTPEDAKGRLLACTSRDLYVKAQMQKKLAAAQRQDGEDPVSLVVDNEEISLISI